MREIKFRAWIKENYYDEKPYMLRQVKAVEPNGDIQINSTLHETKGWYDCHSANDIELMQYTGLKDKNGVEIYEGDIVRDKLGNDFSVSFNQEFCACFLYPVEDPKEFMAFYPNIILEVIGNMYENPELLKEEK